MDTRGAVEAEGTEKTGTPWSRAASGLFGLGGRALTLAVALGLALTMAGVVLDGGRSAREAAVARAAAVNAAAPAAASASAVPAMPGTLEPLGAESDDTVRPEGAKSGTFLIRRTKDDPWAAAPTLATEARFEIAGLVARATVTQRFRNATDGWVEGIYVFPLPEAAAVDHLRMRVGERVIEGQIRERDEARAEYQQAKASGRRASLVEQQRPNVFTTRVANLGPGEEVSVEIELQQLLAFDQGEVRLRFPLVVGPRYVPGQPTAAGEDGGGWSPNTDIVADASQVTPPVRPPAEGLHNPVTIEVALDAGFPVGTLLSRYHAVTHKPEGGGGRRHRVLLQDAQVPADRDFELAWTPRAGRLPQSAAFEEEKDGVRYALVTLFPPVGPAAEAGRLPREVVYVIDTSGSMHGLSIEQARRALLLALERLRRGDRFNVIQFNSTTEALFDTAQPVEPETLERARAFVAGLSANGGTEMRTALEAALPEGGLDLPAGMVRQVVFLTDGSVANEQELFGVIRARLGASRLFTVGIGSAPNGHFMTKAAELGRGSFTYIGDVREVEAKMAGLFARLESPVLTDIRLDWAEGGSVEAWPRRVGDLYLGEPVVVSARLEGPVSGLVVSGRRGGEEWREELALDASRRGQGLAVLWARRKIEALSDSLLEGASADAVRAAITALGLSHHLVTKHTSLVAVDVTPVRPDGEALEARQVATNLPHGWSYGAVFGGELPRTATNLPAHTAAALLALLFAAALGLADRRARKGVRS